MALSLIVAAPTLTSRRVPPIPEDSRNALDALEGALLGALATLKVGPETAELKHWYFAIATVTRNYLLPAWERAKKKWNEPNGRRAHLLSIEWLPGPHTYTALHSAHLTAPMQEALQNLIPAESRLTPQDVYGYERDPGLGNGGLGRLMSCILDSAASRHDDVMGYGLFYNAGFFRQDVRSGQQKELPDSWLVDGENPWGLTRLDRTYEVAFYGTYSDDSGWRNPIRVSFIAHDAMVPSYDGKGANTLRLWKTEHKIETGDSGKDALVAQINERLYPSDHDIFGRDLRLMQEYALVSASLQDILNCHLRRHKKPVDHLPESVAIQLNDTHPALAIPELIRLLVDEHGMDWKKAVELTRASCFYTNHTLLPEALEKCHVEMVRHILPRHYAILQGLQDDLMNEVQEKGVLAQRPQQEIWERQERVSIIHEGQVHMGRLAAFFTKQTNGVAQMHSELVSRDLIPDLTVLRGPNAIVNRTNGISPRSWLAEANPGLASLLTEALEGDAWTSNLSLLDSGLRSLQTDPAFCERFYLIKQANKRQLAALVRNLGGPILNPDALFDIQVKRLHEYKRQFMNALHVAALYLDIIRNPSKARIGTVKIFAGKAAPGYREAKDHIALINWLANRVNNDSRVGDLLKVFFIEDYRVSVAKTIIPAADLSEQISMAGKEASGTSNMKFALNGALTIGTLDGANVEIREKVGPENFFLFGHTKPEIDQLNARGYDPMDFIHEGGWLREALIFLQRETPFGNLTESVWREDCWKIAADFEGNVLKGVGGYCETQQAVHELFQNAPACWLRMAIANTRGGSHFSSDDTIALYVRETWGLVSSDVACVSSCGRPADNERSLLPLSFAAPAA